MAEIKSSIEIAMEKTKGLLLSREERQKLKDEEIRAKAQSLVHRFLEVDFHLREVEKELAKLEPVQRREIEKLVFEYLCAAIAFDRDNDLVFQGIAAFRPEKEPLLAQIKILLKNYQEVREKAWIEAEKAILQNLEKKGISGSAVQPKVEESREWAEVSAKFRPVLEEKLNQLKEELRKT